MIVEPDDDMEIMEPEVNVETQLSTYLQLQMQLFRSVVADTTQTHGEDKQDVDAVDLVNRFSTLQERQMKLISAIQASRYAAEQVS